MSQRSFPFSAGSGDSTSASNAPDGDASANARSTRGDGESSSAIGPAFRAFMPYRTLMPDGSIESGFAERPVIDALHGATGNKEPLILSAADSPARTSPSPASGLDSRGSDPASSSRPCESLPLFSPDGFSLRTYPDSFHLTAAEISPSFSRRWPNSGMGWPGECWTVATSEWPRDAAECSLSAVLEPDPPPRFALSSKAAKVILRRASRRGKKLPGHLEEALESVVGATTSTGRERS